MKLNNLNLTDLVCDPLPGDEIDIEITVHYDII